MSESNATSGSPHRMWLFAPNSRSSWKPAEPGSSADLPISSFTASSSKVLWLLLNCQSDWGACPLKPVPGLLPVFESGPAKLYRYDAST